MIVFLIALAIVGWQALRLKLGFKSFRLAPPPLGPSLRVAIVLVGIPLSALAQNLLGIFGALYVTPVPRGLAGFPLLLLGYTKTTYFAPRSIESAIEFAIVALQSLMLWRLLGADDSSLKKREIVASAALLAIVSLASPLLTSSDIYFYVGAGILGFGSYNPPAMPFSGQFSPLNHQFKVDGTTYGPMWVALNAAVTHLGTTFLQKIEALRIGNALVFLGCYFALVRCDIGKTNRNVFLLNPYIWFFFVATPHNDLFAIFFIIAALGFASTFPLAAVLSIAAAGLIKLPYVLFGAVVFARLRDARARVIAVAGAIAIALAISWAIGGHGYVRALLHAGKTRANDWDSGTALLIGAGAAAFIVLTLLATLARKWFSGAALLAAAMSPYPFPWYAMWGFPYALTEKKQLGVLLAAYPLIGFALDDWYISQPYVLTAFAITIGLFARDLFGMVRIRRARI